MRRDKQRGEIEGKGGGDMKEIDEMKVEEIGKKNQNEEGEEEGKSRRIGYE